MNDLAVVSDLAIAHPQTRIPGEMTMRKSAEKRPVTAATSMSGEMPLDGSASFAEIPLDLAAPKKFKFMIDHLLDDEKEASEGHSGVNSTADEKETNVESAEHSGDLPPKTSPFPGSSKLLQNVACRLEGRDLWNKFYELSTEMIITKTGRLVFTYY